MDRALVCLRGQILSLRRAWHRAQADTAADSHLDRGFGQRERSAPRRAFGRRLVHRSAYARPIRCAAPQDRSVSPKNMGRADKIIPSMLFATFHLSYDTAAEAEGWNLAEKYFHQPRARLGHLSAFFGTPRQCAEQLHAYIDARPDRHRRSLRRRRCASANAFDARRAATQIVAAIREMNESSLQRRSRDFVIENFFLRLAARK